MYNILSSKKLSLQPKCPKSVPLYTNAGMHIKNREAEYVHGSHNTVYVRLRKKPFSVLYLAVTDHSMWQWDLPAVLWQVPYGSVHTGGLGSPDSHRRGLSAGNPPLQETLCSHHLTGSTGAGTEQLQRNRRFAVVNADHHHGFVSFFYLSFSFAPFSLSLYIFYFIVCIFINHIKFYFWNKQGANK